jgi:hypothetical protein
MGNLMESIENLTETIKQSNTFDLSAWVLVAITFVYAVTTIFICTANLRSAKAIREQVAEQKRQFDEANRPIIDIITESIQGAWLGFIFQNTGNRLAREITVNVNDSFIEKLEGADKES